MLLVVVLSMSALGMLAMMSARSDESLSLRSQDVARQVAELNVSAEQSLARLDAVLTVDDAKWLSDRTLSFFTHPVYTERHMAACIAAFKKVAKAYMK